MEYKDNRSLQTLIEKENRGQSSPEYDNTTKQIILCGIAHGMMILHSRGVIHRDLKPDNVLLDSNYRPCITDFGLSKFVDSDVSQSQSHAEIGTTAYIAPEVIESNHYGPKADVYSFAILMYEVITGERAFSEIFKKPHFAIGNFLFRITNGERPVFRSPIKPSLQKLIEECWSSDPHARPSFRTIFEKLSLSLNCDDKIIINSDEKTKLTEHDYEFSEYCLDNVDHDQVYVESITRHETTSTETNLQAIVEEQSKLIKENRELINQLMKQNHQIQIDQLTKQNQDNQKEIELLKRALSSSNSSVFNKEPSTLHEILTSSTPNLAPPAPLARPFNCFEGLTIQQIKEKINKEQLTEISLPSSITDIIDYAFHGCQFTQITIPESVKSIGSNAFSNCLSLTQIIIPPSVKSIKDTAFQNCGSLKSVSIPLSVNSIADSTFSFCESLSQIDNTIISNINWTLCFFELYFTYADHNSISNENNRKQGF